MTKDHIFHDKPFHAAFHMNTKPKLFYDLMELDVRSRLPRKNPLRTQELFLPIVERLVLPSQSKSSKVLFSRIFHIYIPCLFLLFIELLLRRLEIAMEIHGLTF